MLIALSLCLQSLIAVLLLGLGWREKWLDSCYQQCMATGFAILILLVPSSVVSLLKRLYSTIAACSLQQSLINFGCLLIPLLGHSRTFLQPCPAFILSSQ